VRVREGVHLRIDGEPPACHSGSCKNIRYSLVPAIGASLKEQLVDVRRVVEAIVCKVKQPRAAKKRVLSRLYTYIASEF